MKPSLFLAAVVASFCGSCALLPNPPGKPFGPDDYAFMVARPYPKETALAQKRFQNFLRRANANEKLTLSKAPFVAVRAYQLKASEVPGLVWGISLGRVPMKAYYGADLISNTANIPVEFLLVFDQRTGQLAAPDGILVVGTPIRGSIGQYGGIQAIYAGGGWW